MVLFLGSGINFECRNSSNERAPVGTELAKLIKEKFLPGEALPDDLQMVSACVETRESRRHLDRFIYDYLMDFEPCDYVLKKIPSFVWRRIYTTNYDILLEKAYQSEPQTKQKLIEVYSDKDRQDNITLGVDLPYYKVHGCITKITSDGIPLILTAMDYANYRNNRKRLFWRLQDDFFEHTFLFIGYSFLDTDFQNLFFEVQSDIQDIRDFPRCYAISPNVPQAISDYWDTRKVVILNYTAKDFFALIKDIPSETPSLPQNYTEQIRALSGRFKASIDSGIAGELLKSFDIVNDRLGHDMFDHKNYYRGDCPNWAVIRNECDAIRDYYELIMDDILLVDESEKPDLVEVAIITAEAGGGKSTLLMRLAYDQACDFEGFCLYHKNFQEISFPALEDVYKVLKKRIYIYIDDAADNIGQLSFIAKRAKALSIPITLIAAERKNEWNAIKERLLPIIPIEYELPYLSEAEIDKILNVLENKNYLCELKNKSFEDRKAAFTEKAEKQLLVAMREATEGEDFEKIIQNEYDDIPSSKGKNAYLIICSLHRLGVKIRAGLLKRLTGVSFERFQEELLQPCERVIVFEEDESTNQHYFRSRHSYIAEIVCRYQLNDPSLVSEIYLKILNSMDIGFSSDLYSFRELVRADSIIDTMPNIEHRRLFYNTALSLSENDAFVYQQFGIMELRHNNISEAESYLEKACGLDPNNQAYKHSYARLLFDKSQSTPNKALKERLFERAQKVLVSIIKAWPTNPYAYNSYAQNLIGIANKHNDIERTEEILKEAHEMILNGLRFCYEKSYLLATEGRIFQLLGDYQKAKNLLYQSHNRNQSSARTALLLGRLLIKHKEYPQAYEVITTALRYNELHVTLNFLAAEILTIIDPKLHDKIISHLKKAYDPNYIDYNPNYMLGFEYFKFERYPESEKIFSEFRKRKMFTRDRESYKIRNFLLDENGRQLKFDGEIVNIFGKKGFIKADLFPSEIFFHPNLSKVKVGNRVSFSIGFNLFGPIADGSGVTH